MNSPGSGMVVVVVVVVVVVGGTVVVVGGTVVVVVVVGAGTVVVVVVLDVVVVVGATVVVVVLVVVGGDTELGGLAGRSVVEVVDGGAATSCSVVPTFDGSIDVVEGVDARFVLVVVPAGEAPSVFPVAVRELEDAAITVAGAIDGTFVAGMASPRDDAAESGIAHARPTIRPTTEIRTTMARNARALSRSG